MPSSDTSAPPCGCRFRREARHHHDLLLGMEDAGFAELTELVETAVLWTEVEHGDEVIPPELWFDFVEQHHWRDPDTVVSFVLALQSIVRRPVRPDTTATVRHLRAVPDDGSEPVGSQRRAHG